MNINHKLVAVAKQLGPRYTLNERAISPEEMFAETGLLPALARRADQLASLCLGYFTAADQETARR